MAAYYNEYDDKQEEIIEPDGFGGSNTIVANASSAELWGVEAEATWIANANLLFNANLGYQDAEYDSFDRGPERATVDNVTDNSDLELRRVPEWTGGVNGTYTVAVGPGDLSFFASYRYTDEYWVDVQNDPRSLLDDRGRARRHHRLRVGVGPGALDTHRALGPGYHRRGGVQLDGGGA